MISYRIDPPRRLILATATGNLTAEEIRNYQAARRADSGFDPSFALLADFRGASLSEVTSADIRRAAEDAPFAPESPRALVVSDEANYGLARMFEAYSEISGRKGPLKAFHDQDSAWAWIEDVRGERR